MRSIQHVILSIAVVALLIGCTKVTGVRTMTIDANGLTIHAAVSVSRENAKLVNGRILVRNTTAGFMKYGNSGLDLTVGTAVSKTHVRTGRVAVSSDSLQIDAMADTRLIDLAPGDSMVFVSYWKFDRPVDFIKEKVLLSYLEPLTPRAAALDTTAKVATGTLNR